MTPAMPRLDSRRLTDTQPLLVSTEFSSSGAKLPGPSVLAIGVDRLLDGKQFLRGGPRQQPMAWAVNEVGPAPA